MKKILMLILALTAGCTATEEGLSVAPESLDRAALSVYVVNYPLQYFAGRIGGDRVEVSFPAPAEGDPAYWNPDAETIAAYQQADLILLNGASYAKWTDRATLPASKLVDTSVSFKDRYIIVEDAVVHSHGPEGEHSHGETAFTTWLDPTLAVKQARAIRDALTKARPDAQSAFEAGFASLETDLLALDARLERAVDGKNNRLLVGSHPVYQYLARRYGLNLRAVHFEPDQPTANDGWHDLEHVLDEHPAKWMLWADAPIRETADRLRELGMESVVYNPCGNRPSEGDYLSVMRSNVAAIEGILSGDWRDRAK